jgi:hypothetical protein
MENELNKMTAVEWLWEQIDEILPFSVDTETGIKLYSAKEQAKEMEKEQIKDAYFIGGHDIKNNRYRGMHEYYEQTYQEVTNDTTNK